MWINFFEAARNSYGTIPGIDAANPIKGDAVETFAAIMREHMDSEFGRRSQGAPAAKR